MTLEFVNSYIDEKIKENPKFLRFTHIELRVKQDLNERDTLAFISIAARKLKEEGYSIYRTKQKYFINGEVKEVEENELLIAKKR